MKLIIWKVFYNYEKEEAWLNGQSSKGLQLVDYFWTRYVFEEGEPEEYQYRIEFMSHFRKHQKSIEYIKFLKELKIECVGTYMYWIILRKKKVDGNFEVYTEIEDQIKQYKKIRNWWFCVAGFEYLVALFELVLGFGLIHTENQITWGPFVCGFLIFIIGTGLLSVGLPIHRKIKQLEKEKEVFESYIIK